MEKRLILAAALSLGVLLLWEWLVVPRTAQRPRLTPSPATAVSPLTSTALSATPAATAPAATARALPPAVSALAPETTTLANSFMRVRLSNRGGVIESLVLLKHTDDEGKPLEIVRQLPPPAPRPLSLEFPSDPAATSLAASALYNMEIVSPRAVRMRYADDRLAVTGTEVHVDPAAEGGEGTGVDQLAEAAAGSNFIATPFMQ